MKQIIWVYALCYNESHFIGNFLTAYKDADRIIIYDNHSTDNSVELLMRDPRVEIRYFDSNSELRDDIHIQIKDNCWKEARGKADWVIVVDFDEVFARVTVVNGEVVFDLDLSEPYNNGFNVIKPYGYNMISLDAPLYTNDHPFKHCPRGAYHPPAEKPCCFRPDQIGEMNYTVGCHTADPLDIKGSRDGVRILYDKNYKHLHFRFWNYDLYIKKAEVGRNRLSSVNKDHGWGWQYLETNEQQSSMYLAGMKLSKHLIDIEK